MRWEVRNQEALRGVAVDFLEHIKPRTIVTLDGPMGVGKTTFVSAIADVLGTRDTVNSPSFTIINEYHTEKAPNLLYHFDLYRLRSFDELLGIGAEDYLYSGAYCFIEWPELMTPMLPDDTVHCRLSEEPDGTRIIEVDG